MSDVVVGLDFGSSRIKAAAYGRDGALLRSSAVETPLRPGQATTGDGFPVLACLDAAADALARLALPAGTIRALGLSSMGEVGTVLSGGALAGWDFPSWYGRVGAEIEESLVAGFGRKRLAAATGNHTVLVSTVAKLGGMLSGRGRVSGTFLGLCGAFAWQLTGQVWQEAGLATTSGVFDPVGGEYLTELWEYVGLADVELPPVREPGFSAPARTGLARRLGLSADARVVIAGHDHPVGTVGAGVQPGERADSLGTGQAILARVEPHRLEPVREALLADPGLSLEVWPDGGGVLAVWGPLRPGLAMRTFLSATASTREQLDEQAPPPGQSDVLDPEIAVAMEQGDASAVTGSAVQWASLIDYYVLRAVAARRWLGDLTGADGTTVLTGGGLRSVRWRHAHALLSDAPLAVSTVSETGTRGAAGIAGSVVDWWGSAAQMPGATRIEVPAGDLAQMDRAARALFGAG
ncbi:sugar (pentulose or hexulose) kinase [Propionicimonas paludicola]|uniref:Sugar (Pentulose or hexulose) kinase n=1 Tax=Propionicimonas paludicola TaxID=185243 RepID=A0A2A9CPM4_9ACTN|nr:FGGY family carbohydrate kinase [Propionicimonas paludicola]PFG15562.1 sugar (pentulose or hexulose) kinase [Propionicimonas paludicola]